MPEGQKRVGCKMSEEHGDRRTKVLWNPHCDRSYTENPIVPQFSTNSLFSRKHSPSIWLPVVSEWVMSSLKATTSICLRLVKQNDAAKHFSTKNRLGIFFFEFLRKLVLLGPKRQYFGRTSRSWRPTQGAKPHASEERWMLHIHKIFNLVPKLSSVDQNFFSIWHLFCTSDLESRQT